MYTKWQFIFENKHLDVDTVTPEETMKVRTGIESGAECLFVHTENKSVYINTKRCIVITEEQVKESVQQNVDDEIKVD